MKKKVLRERRNKTKGIVFANKGLTFKVDEPTEEVFEKLAKKEKERVTKVTGRKKKEDK